MKFFISLFSTFLLLNISLIFTQDIKFTHLRVKDGLSNDMVVNVLKDRLGYMWFATSNGLDRYNGYTIKRYTYDPNNPFSPRSNYINCLLEDTDGTIWIGLELGGVCRYDRANDRFETIVYDSLNQKNYLNIVYSMIQDPDQPEILWLGSKIGLVKLHIPSGTYKIYKPIGPNPLINISAPRLAMDKNGSMWVGSYEGGLNKFDPRTEVFSLHLPFPERGDDARNVAIMSIFIDSRNRLWVGTAGELYLFDLTSEQYIPLPKPLQHIATNFRSFLEEEDGKLWISSHQGGLYLYDMNSEDLRHFINNPYIPESISTNQVGYLYKDDTGILWVASDDGGINIFDPNSEKFKDRFPVINNDIDKENRSFKSAYMDKNNTIWIGTDKGLNKLNKNRKLLKTYINDPNNPGSIGGGGVTALYEDSKGRFWVGNWGGSLHRFDREKEIFHRYEAEHGVYDNPHKISNPLVLDIEEDKNGYLWLGTVMGILERFDPETELFEHFDFREWGAAFQREVIVDEKSDCIWSVSSAGLFRLNRRSKQVKVYQHETKNPKSLSDNNVMGMIQNDDGSLWLTTGKGLNHFNPETEEFTHYGLADGFASEYLLTLRKDRDGNLWISGDRGIIRFNPASGQCWNYDEGDGVRPNAGFAYQMPDGEIIFGGSEGINAFYPREIKDNEVLPRVVLSDFKLFNKSISFGPDSPLSKPVDLVKQITLTYKQSVFTLEFAALNYTHTEKNQYRYIMEGFNDHWIESGLERKATYTNLNPGDYTFKVMASNNDGIWNPEPLRVMITILPPFWMTWWFRALVILSIAGSVYWWYRQRMNRIQKQKRELEIQVEERTEDLRQKTVALETAKKETDDILHNAKEGLFLLDRQYKLGSQYALILESIFERKDLVGKNFFELFKDNTSDSLIKTGRRYIDIMLRGEVDEEILDSLNPMSQIQMSFENGKRTKYLSFEFSRIKSIETGELELMATVRDITEQVILEQKLKESEERTKKQMNWMLSILHVDPRMLQEFIDGVQRELDYVDSILDVRENNNNYKELLQKIFRSIHLIKGNASLLALEFFADQAHKFEDEIYEIQKKPKIADKDMKGLVDRLLEMRESLSQVNDLLDRIGQIHTQMRPKRSHETKMLIKSLNNLITQLSSDSGKKIKFVHTNFKGSSIPHEYWLITKDILIQLIRNSIAHGIESPKERISQNKTEEGCIELSTNKTDKEYQFILRDDGRGIQTDKLKEKALASDKWNKEEIQKWSDKEIIELLYESGISTAETIDMGAGRGVGMDGVRDRILSHQGTIEVNFEPGKYTEFLIALPIKQKVQ